MKRNILAICAVATAASLFAQDYQIVVTTKDGEKQVFATDNDVSSIVFTNAPEYTKANTFIEGRYNPKAQNAEYVFAVGTEEPDDQGQPAFEGSVQMQLSLFAPLSAEAQNAVLPEGYYRIGNSGASYTLSAESSAVWIRYGNEEDEVAVGYIVGGTVDVRHDGDNYDVRAEVDLLDGTHMDVSFYGGMKFAVGASGSVDFDTDQNVAFTEGQGRVWANWFNPFCDDASLQFFTGKFTDSGSQTEGYCLYLPIFMPKDDAHTSTWSPVITDGVYIVDPRESISSQTYLPNTLQRGAMLEFFGSTTPTGAYITYLAADGRLSLALLVDGSMTVSEGGTKFAFDFTAENGIKITGSYDKKPYVVNMIDNSNQPETPDDLTGDYVISKFPSDAVILDYNMGDYIVQGLNSHILIFSDPDMTEGDYLSVDLFSESEKIKDGTYTIDNSFTDMSGIKGVVNYQGGMAFSWYGDLDSTDDEGYQSILAPVSGGTLTVKTLDDGTCKVDFNLLDLKGNKMTGSVTLPIHYASEDQTEAAAKVERCYARALGSMQRTWSGNHTDTPSRTLLRK